MAVKHFHGAASKVAQLVTVTVGGTLSGETFTVSVGGVVIATHTDSSTVIADTVAALVSAWNSSTHPYATGVTAVDASPDVELTADTAGVPFTPVENTPGGSATFVLVETVDNSGPNVLSLADNWDGSALPGAGDELHFADGTIPICWDVDGLNTLTYGDIYFDKSYTGKIGLNYQVFATSTDGSAVSTQVTEYRPTHLEIKTDGNVFIGGGQKLAAAGPGRLCLDVLNVACTIEVIDTVATSADVGRHAVRLRGNHTGTKVFIRNAPGGVGIGTDVPGETAVFDTIEIADNAPLTCKVGIGTGVTYDGLVSAGIVVIWSGPSGSNIIEVLNGILTTEGTGYDVHELIVQALGTCYCNHEGSGATSVSTLTLSGVADFLGSRKARTVDAVVLNTGHTLRHDPDVLTLTAVSYGTGEGPPI